MKIRFTDSSGSKVERDCASWSDVSDAVLRHLEIVDKASLRRAHTWVMKRVFASNGPVRMGMGITALKPIEEEMRRRGMEADYWSIKHKLRSDLAFVKVQRRACDSAAHSDYASRLDEQERSLREELRLLDAREGH